jgi:hypothetical protein
MDNLSVVQILTLVNQLLTDWGVMPFLQGGLVILTVVSAIVYLRRLGTGS